MIKEKGVFFIKKTLISLAIALFLFSLSIPARVVFGGGGYVPFGPSTQKDLHGGRETFSFDSALSWSFHLPFQTSFSQFFIPEWGYVFHRLDDDAGYSKRTSFVLFDLGISLAPDVLFRYGIGTFITKIDGPGGSLTVNDGGAMNTAYLPGRSISSWNTTLNLGTKIDLNSKLGVRFEFFLFSPLSSTARKFSYLLNLVCYL